MRSAVCADPKQAIESATAVAFQPDGAQARRTYACAPLAPQGSETLENKAKMLNMEDSIAHEPVPARTFMLPAWKTVLNATAACVLCFLFVISGVGKIVDPFG